MQKVIHKLLTLIAISVPLLASASAFADEDPSVAYSTPLLPNVVDYQVNGDMTLDVNVAAVNALEITLSTSRILLDLVPGMVDAGYDSKDLTITVGTTNATGYTLTMDPIYDGASTTSLTRTEAINNETPVIETLSATTTPDIFSSLSDTTTVNKWGYKLGSTNLDVDKTVYIPVLTSNTINLNTAAVSNDPTSISFAAKASNELPAGTYRATLKFTAVANPLGSYTINYYSNPYQVYNSGLISTVTSSSVSYGRQWYKRSDGIALVATCYFSEYSWANTSVPSNPKGNTQAYTLSEQTAGINLEAIGTDKNGTVPANSSSSGAKTVADAQTATYDGVNYYSLALWSNPGVPIIKAWGLSKKLLTSTVSNANFNASYVTQFILQNNDTDSEKKSQEIQVDISTPLSANTFSRSGMTFQGWSTTPTGEVLYTDQESVYNLADADGVVKLYAIWR